MCTCMSGLSVGNLVCARWLYGVCYHFSALDTIELYRGNGSYYHWVQIIVCVARGFVIFVDVIVKKRVRG